MKQNTIVYKISENLKDEIIDFYKNDKVEKNPPYSVFQARLYDCIVTLYESGKIMFQGLGADIEASYWFEQERIKNSRDINKEIKKDKDKKEERKEELNDNRFKNVATIGSDEVGTGDYFGPIVVTASYVSLENSSLLYSLGVKDSKKITDDKIIKIAPTIIKEIPHVTYILDNKKYNEFGITNMNKVKAILHNKVLTELKKKVDDYKYIVVDQFCYPTMYFKHIFEVNEKTTNITFTTHAEDKCLSVAASSIISRYIFLLEMDKMSKSLGMPIPKGAGNIVDDIGYEIVKKFGKDKLNSIAKLNFKNTEKILNRK